MKRTISLILFMALLVGLLSGCGIGGKDHSLSTENNAEELPSVPAEQEDEENADELLMSVLSGGSPMVMPGGAAEYLSEYLQAQNNAELISYALVDFDHDKRNELVLETSSDLYTYIVLHCSGSDVFAFLFGARQLGELKADGSFLGSNGAASAAYFTLRFNGGGYISVCEASGDYVSGIFEINGNPCTEQEFDEFVAAWDDKEPAEWISLKAPSGETLSPQESDEVVYTYGEFCPTMEEYADFVMSLTPETDHWVLTSDDENSIIYTSNGDLKNNKGILFINKNMVLLSKGTSDNGERTFQLYYSPCSTAGGIDFSISSNLYSRIEELLPYAAPILLSLPGTLSSKDLVHLFESEQTISGGVRSYETTVNSVTYTIHQDTTGKTTAILLSIDENAPVPKELLLQQTYEPEQINPPESKSQEGLPPVRSESTIPYLQKVSWADQSIYAGPSYDYSFVGTVEVAGTYTIVEEAWDEEGNLWGKLKSGAGWVDLTDIRSEERRSEPISANYADKALLDSGNYHHCIADTSEYMVQIAFRTNEILTDFTLHSMQFNGDDFVAEEVLFSLEELNPDKPLIADVAFPGDMSMYGISFTDSNGTIHNYAVSISGRNGSLILAEFTP